jgi:hypothetical protein
MILALVAIGSISTVGCKKEDGVVTPVTLDETNQQLVDALFSVSNLDLTGYNDSEVYVMNSNDDLWQLVGDMNIIIPEVDFEKYSIVWGYVVLLDTSYELLSSELSVRDGKYIMNVHILSGQMGLQVIRNGVFWGVYPKIEEPISLDVSYIDISE